MRVRAAIDRYTPQSPVKAIAHITLDELFVVSGFRVMYNRSGELDIYMPQQNYTDRKGEKHYTDIFHSITAEARSKLKAVILTAYQAHAHNEKIKEQSRVEELQPKLGQTLDYQELDVSDFEME